MSEARGSGRGLRALWMTFAVLCLVAAGAAYGATRVLQSDLELEATGNARDLALDELRPLVHPNDVAEPVRGQRYATLLASVRKSLLKGPTDEVRIWRPDGTIVFATDRDQVGERFAVTEDLGRPIAGTARSVVEDGRFRTYTWMRVGDGSELVVVELARPYAAVVRGPREQWYPWIPRALAAAAVCALLYLATVAGFAVLGAVRRRGSGRADPEGAPAPGRRAAWNPNLPDYMRPGFRQEVEARRQMELEVQAGLREREDLAARLQRAEAGREEARSAAASGA